jgi:hypothetical protein
MKYALVVMNGAIGLDVSVVAEMPDRVLLRVEGMIRSILHLHYTPERAALMLVREFAAVAAEYDGHAAFAVKTDDADYRYTVGFSSGVVCATYPDRTEQHTFAAF